MDYRITTVTPAEFPVLTEIWEEVVRGTHLFLEEEDIPLLRQKSCVDRLPELAIKAVRDSEGILLGFCGVKQGTLELLFLSHEARGLGIGRTLLELAIEDLGARKLNVYEENTLAADIYRRRGFVTVERSPVDHIINKPHPLLHMELRENDG